MEPGALLGLRRRPAEEEQGGPGDAKRVCRSLEGGLGEDADRGPSALPQVCWTPNGGSQSKGFFAWEMTPGDIQGSQSSAISANNGRRPTQPCLRCLAGESACGECLLVWDPPSILSP
ncbi:uncharacterized protein C10orf143 homolog isoform X2 [Dromiciops gliroides]|uniref:uncharacterized protein C10orf143 homolog isoform X2 n=1 Tax=Dromiciops gliroides TaxID=33562 RepID=UPI001CC3865E|nr:uncharacterized protein C10orf143 homolog isoform X2 [Dromiciops gliroides]